MKLFQGSTPQPEHPEPTTNEETSRSLSNNNGEQNGGIASLSAFDELLNRDGLFFRTESRLLARLAAGMKVPASEIDDVVQEVWLEAAKHCDQFAGPMADVVPRLRCWLTKAVYYKALKALDRLHSFTGKPLDASTEELIDSADAKRSATAELHEWLDALLVQASGGNEGNLRLLRGHFFQGFSIKDLAQQSGLTEKAVDRRICRVLERVREIVAEDSSSSAFKPGFGKANWEKMEKIKKSAGDNGPFAGFLL